MTDELALFDPVAPHLREGGRPEWSDCPQWVESLEARQAYLGEANDHLEEWEGDDELCPW